MPFWSSISIPGKPAILVVDTSGNVNGWESEFCNRLFHSLERSKIKTWGEEPLRTLDDLNSLSGDHEAFNVILLCTHNLKNDWSRLQEFPWLQQKLLAVCSWDSYDPETCKQILGSTPLAIVPQSETTPREAGLFYLKFFTELNLHSKDHISGKMVWFSFAKAKEILKKRRYEGKFSVRC